VTRGRERLTILASEDIVRAAIRHPVARASGLRERLWPAAIGADG
jgi:ATP-dependent exoDNAse (exonuclease V) alpha subunit